MALDRLAKFGCSEFPLSLTAKALPLGSNSFPSLSEDWIRSLPYVIQNAFPEGVEVQLAVIGQSKMHHEILDLPEFGQFRVVPLIQHDDGDFLVAGRNKGNVPVGPSAHEYWHEMIICPYWHYHAR